jgi:hypothetical protein
MGDWKDWGDWVKEGHYLSYVRDNVRYYEHVIFRDLAHYVYEWHETIGAGKTSGPKVPNYLIVTLGYNEVTNQNHIWQMIFGIKGQVYIYIELPTDIHRHGLPKVPKPSEDLREVSHFEEWMSPFQEPTFLTEHFMMKPGFDRISFSAYNPQDIDIKPYLNIFVAKLVTERIGTEQEGVLRPTANRWKEVLEKLYKRVIPHRPLTLMPVRAPAAEN